MSFEIKKFLDFLGENSQLLEYIKKHNSDEAYNLLKSLGYEFSLEEFKKSLDILKKNKHKDTIFS